MFHFKDANTFNHKFCGYIDVLWLYNVNLFKSNFESKDSPNINYCSFFKFKL